MDNFDEKEENDELLPAFTADDLTRILGDTNAVDKLLEKTKNMMWSLVQYKEIRLTYACALKEIRTKFEVLDEEFKLRYKRNPISGISTRLKSTESIFEKLLRYGAPLTLESMVENLNDIAGIRVICSYIDDIYGIADAFLKQDDVTLIESKDYIKDPKKNGYRSLHLIVSIPVFFAKMKKQVKVEVQIRTIAMDFWASLDHQMGYKQQLRDDEGIIGELKACAETIAATDEKMLALRKKIEAAKDVPTEEDILLEKLRRFDMPLG